MNKSLLNERLKQVAKLKPEWRMAISKLEEWLEESDAFAKHRINPFIVMNAIGTSLRTIVGVFLYGVKTSTFQLHWDLHCPHCNMITDEYSSLGTASGNSHCKMCNIDYTADFADRVEVTFSLHPEIDNTELPAFCPPPKHLKVYTELGVEQGQSSESDFEISEGTYRYFCPITMSKGILHIEGNPVPETQEMVLNQMADSRFDHPVYRLKPGKVHVKVSNLYTPFSGLFITEENLTNPIPPENLGIRLSGLALTHFPEFKEVFGEESLSSREKMTISGVTILFTDITGSTKMYEELGDIKAYNLVRDHFDILTDTIQSHGGIVLKTIGDAVMASFLSSSDSLRSVYSALEKFKAFNAPKSMNEQINLKIGIHSGPAILVNLNNRIDYFGNTVNKAARIQSLADNKFLCMSEEVFSQTGVKSILKEQNIKRVTRKFKSLKGLTGEHPIMYVPLENIE